MRIVRIIAIASYLVGMALFVNNGIFPADTTRAQASPTPAPAAFDQAAAIAKLEDQIKGREQEPAEKVFKTSRRRD